MVIIPRASYSEYSIYTKKMLYRKYGQATHMHMDFLFYLSNIQKWAQT
jgi:hypothetical protein